MSEYDDFLQELRWFVKHYLKEDHDKIGSPILINHLQSDSQIDIKNIFFQEALKLFTTKPNIKVQNPQHNYAGLKDNFKSIFEETQKNLIQSPFQETIDSLNSKEINEIISKNIDTKLELVPNESIKRSSLNFAARFSRCYQSIEQYKRNQSSTKEEKIELFRKNKTIIDQMIKDGQNPSNEEILQLIESST